MLFEIYLILPLLLSIRISDSTSCTLNDASKTLGECINIRNCRYQIGRLRIGLPVINCNGNKTVVCCPKGLSISEQKCEEWKELLYAPTAFDLPRSEVPICGAVYNLFVRGRNAVPFEYPHAVALGYGADVNQLKFLCGATLISERFLLTAAHCITKEKGKPSYAVIGDGSISMTRLSLYRKVVKIINHIIHPQYRPPLIYNDIAILELAQPLQLDRYTLPACVGTPITSPKRNSLVEGSGWGLTEGATTELQVINVTMMERATCNQIYALESDKLLKYPNGIMKSQICVTEQDICRGDVGGGLLIRDGRCLFHLVGISSITSKICGLGNASVYTTVASYQNWIEEIVWGSEIN